MHIVHLFDQRYGKPRVLRDNLRRNLPKQLASVSVSVSVCVRAGVCACVYVAERVHKYSASRSFVPQRADASSAMFSMENTAYGIRGAT